VVLDFPDTNAVNWFKKTQVDSLRRVLAANLHSPVSFETGTAQQLQLAPADTVFNVLDPNLENIPKIVEHFAKTSSPIETFVFGAHGLEPGKVPGINEYTVYAQTGDSTGKAYRKDAVTKILQSIPRAALSPDAKVVIITCFGDRCVDAQAVTNTLRVPVYTSPEAVHEFFPVEPHIIYGVFNEFTPELAPFVPAHPDEGTGWVDKKEP